MTRLEDRVALITGGSRGIGAAIAEVFAREGARVAIHGRDRHALAEVAERIGSSAVVVTGDVTKPDDLARVRAEVESALGPIDIAVANAGGSPVPPGPLEDITVEDWHASVDTNLTATFLTLKELLPGMKERGRGVIITLSSAAARRPTARSPVAYTAAKAGIELLTQSAALQAGPFGVRVCCIAPETILTERNAAQIPAAVQEALAQEHPLRRLGTPQDVAEAALYLASDSASWVTGVVLDVAGGSVLR